ncbi:Oidioi.mRNA.OKI2018_I69.chr2.g4950.t1.cds [Oikopleura dioica]|uniref:Oidioi.mRNA.OKI2018_I69.chr2.g4950.t1.cds n=1 Tax=Oikopleura dioica TaxID=34765 RepID=A0ABN7SYM9_OIKDI|nr:Oidioi.mRNA.OKI2018_I69.chr2.g4950.t1.cds [Oikopleura dioica]
MPITLAQRELVVKKMDEQFASDLKMRKEALDIGKKSTFLYGNLKDYKSFGTYVNDMTYQARANTKAIEGMGLKIVNHLL